MKKILATIILLMSFSINSWARGGGGGHSIGFGLGFATASQDDLENHATLVNQTISGRNATKPGSGLEFSGYYEYRFSSTMFAMHFRPSYFTQTGSGGTDKYSLSGMTLFPMLRLYPLENSFIRFFLEAGLGYGKLSGVAEQPGGKIEFSGGAFGAVGGLGAQFCFTDDHCMFLEGMFRYLPFERNLVSSSYSNTPGTTGFSQSGSGGELEFASNDLKTSMSGLVGNIGYQMNF